MKNDSTIHSYQAATRLKSKLLLDHPCDMELEDIAWTRGILVKDDDLIGAEGRLVLMNQKGLITVSNGIREPGRRRFTIAHELGHFELHSAEDHLDKCNNNDFFDKGNIRQDEQEANDFAMELLMPTDLLKARCQNLEPSWEAIKKLAEEFLTTMTLTAIRFVLFSTFQVALIFSENSQIKWFRASDSFRFRIKTGVPLHPESFAYTFFQPPKVEQNFVPAKAWIREGEISTNVVIREHCLHLPRYESVMSLVWLESGKTN